MRISSQVAPDKLRGGFYSPPALVKVCLDRLEELLADSLELKVLEPSAGDGAFLRGLSEHALGKRVARVIGVELVAAEAAKARASIENATFPADVKSGSFLESGLVSEGDFDAAIGNPPFVRFQFVPESERVNVEALGIELGLEVRGVSNLWIPIFLRALSRLREGGAFAFIVPAECLTGISASVVRRWLLLNTRQLQIDLFSPGSFPGVLQEVVVISGIVGRGNSGELTICEHGSTYRCWRHVCSTTEPTWTRYLLTPGQLASLRDAAALAQAKFVGEVARFSVSTVTGANDFFSVNAATIEQYDLSPWVIPLLPRIRNAAGIVFTDSDQTSNSAAGIRAGLLDFSGGRPDPADFAGAAQYLQAGVKQKLHERYKCKIRSPWYRVPVVKPGDLLLSKRSHLYPRAVLNEASVVTTDTIYQGTLLPGYEGMGEAFVSSFHNSLTLLSAEIEGRSFGGGVLELVPSEVARLQIFVVPEMANHVERLDAIARSIDPEKDDSLVQETDRHLAKTVPGLTDEMLASLSDARYELQQRRLDRNRSL